MRRRCQSVFVKLRHVPQGQVAAAAVPTACGCPTEESDTLWQGPPLVQRGSDARCWAAAGMDC